MIIQAVAQEAIKQVMKLQEESHVSQFLMNLCPEFEAVRASIMNREPTPDLETCVQEVLREELPLQTQQTLEGNTTNQAFSTILTATTEIAMYTNPKFQSKDNEKDMGAVQCFECKGYAHVARNCKKKIFCNYCKRNGHIISECTRCPPRKPGHALQSKTESSSDSPPDLIKEMIQTSVNSSIASALSAMGITGNTAHVVY